VDRKSQTVQGEGGNSTANPPLFLVALCLRLHCHCITESEAGGLQRSALSRAATP